MTTDDRPGERGRNISAPETADRLGVSLRTLDRMERDGRLRPASRIGGRRKYDEDRVEKVRHGCTCLQDPGGSLRITSGCPFHAARLVTASS